MKKNIHFFSALLFLCFLLFCFSACAGSEKPSDSLWGNATYLTDTEIGEGAKTFSCEVKAGDRLVTLTVHTDKETVGDALSEWGLISGEEGDYGLYIKTVNGITADYDIDQSYWLLYVNGEYALSGADSTECAEGAVYRLEYTK